jgi:hypothetical protein
MFNEAQALPEDPAELRAAAEGPWVRLYVERWR